MTKPRFLHVFSTFDHGGAEDRTIRILADQRDVASHSIWVGVPAAMGAKTALDPAIGVDFSDEAASLVLGRPSLARYRRIAQALQRYDLILTYSWGAMDVTMAHRLFARRMQLPPLIHHDDGFDHGGHNFTHDLFRRFALGSCHAHVVPSKTLVTISRNIWKVPSDRIKRITNGIDLSAFGASSGSASFPGLESKVPHEVVVGSIAGLRLVKNLPRLVRAVSAAGPNIRLAIAGTGADRERIEQEAAGLGMADRLLLPGFLPNPASYVGAFDIFALSSDSEQGPIAMIQAMAAGLPVVSTDVGDIRAMVSAENQPFIVPLKDEAALAAAIARLAADPELRRTIGAANRAKAQAEFDDQVMFASFRQLYLNAVA